MMLYVATKNSHKLKEIAAILDGTGVSVASAYDVVTDMPDVEETGCSFAENAAIKAVALSERIDGYVIADDSGICADALDGAPGIFSARYAGEGATDEQNWRKLLDAMKDVPAEKRSARFVCVIALAVDGAVEVQFEGVCEGSIGFEARGEHGFGYDPVFVRPDGRGMAELTPDEKNRISHRSRALAGLREYLLTAAK